MTNITFSWLRSLVDLKVKYHTSCIGGADCGAANEILHAINSKLEKDCKELANDPVFVLAFYPEALRDVLFSLISRCSVRITEPEATEGFIDYLRGLSEYLHEVAPEEPEKPEPDPEFEHVSKFGPGGEGGSTYEIGADKKIRDLIVGIGTKMVGDHIYLATAEEWKHINELEGPDAFLLVTTHGTSGKGAMYALDGGFAYRLVVPAKATLYNPTYNPTTKDHTQTLDLGGGASFTFKTGDVKISLA